MTWFFLTMTMEFPTTPLTQNTVNIEINESNFDKEGFHMPIIGTAIAASVNAHKTITQSSNVTCERE